MNDRHLGETEHHGHGGDRCDGVAHDDSGPRVADGDAAPHEQSRTDRAAQPDHDELGAAKILVQSSLAAGDLRGIHRSPLSRCVAMEGTNGPCLIDPPGESRNRSLR